jgi:hypothetical protein
MVQSLNVFAVFVMVVKSELIGKQHINKIYTYVPASHDSRIPELLQLLNSCNS